LFRTYLLSVGILRLNFSVKVAEYLDAYGLNILERVGGTDKNKSKAVELCLSCGREWCTKSLWSRKIVLLSQLKFEYDPKPKSYIHTELK
jgi:hypothetical protein